MLEKKTILLLYGEGRYDTSIMAVKDYLEDKKDCYVVAISDKELYPFFRYKIAIHSYKLLNRSCAWLNKLYLTFNTLVNKLGAKQSKKECKELKKPSDGLGEIFYSWTEQYRRIRNVLLKYNPEMVLCSTPKLLRDTARACDKAKIKDINIGGLITDYALDSRFVNYKVTNYFVQNDNVKERLASFGINEDIIQIMGTPLPQSGKMQFERSQILQELGINNDKKNVVIVGGRYGASAIKGVFTTIAELDVDINIIVASSGNNGLVKYCELIAKNRGIENRLYIIEEIDEFAKLYAVADILITSPTATITYEALYHNLKLVVCEGGDAIENRNAHYLATNQLALLGRNNEELVASLSKFMSDEEFFNDMVNIQNEFVVPNCDKALGDAIERIAEENRQNKLIKIKQAEERNEKTKLMLENKEDSEDNDND